MLEKHSNAGAEAPVNLPRKGQGSHRMSACIAVEVIHFLSGKSVVQKILQEESEKKNRMRTESGQRTANVIAFSQFLLPV